MRKNAIKRSKLDVFMLCMIGALIFLHCILLLIPFIWVLCESFNDSYHYTLNPFSLPSPKSFSGLFQNYRVVYEKLNITINSPGRGKVIRNGQDRLHERYGSAEKENNKVVKGQSISYAFAETEINCVHITFDSDLNRQTLEGSWIEQGRSMRAMRRLDSPQLHMPTTLCKEFELIGRRGGVSTCLLHVKNNRKRSYQFSVKGVFDELILIPKSSWGEDEEIAVISFDFS